MTLFRRAKSSFRTATGVLVSGMFAACALMPVSAASATTPPAETVPGVSAGSIQHVWLIILENKSYDETFTGLNNNSYLWQTLPSEGVLLKNYYGTGHSSMDNYISLVSGQAPVEDTQEDCSDVNVPMGSNSTIITTGSVGSDSPNWNFGQVSSLLDASQPSGANAPLGANGSTATNGCTYPSEVPTLFDQFNAAGVSWKGYAQDLGGAQPIGSTSFVNDAVPGRDDGPCGAPGSSSENPVSNPTFLTATSSHPLPSDVSSYTAASLVAGTGTTNNPQYSDAYVAKHFPFPWFESLIGSYDPTTGATGAALTEPLASAGGGTNCDANHIANLDSPTDGLVHDLQDNTVPAFSWITPDNCSDAHDTTCKGNNLSGAFGLNADGTVNLNDPIYNPPGLPAYDPEATKPINYTGGLYASDLFLAYYIPLIEASSAYAHGLIDITFDEGEPSFTYSGNSFNNVPTTGADGQGTTSPLSTSALLNENSTFVNNTPTFGASGSTAPGADSVYGAYAFEADAAGENINGTNVSTEPWGPNSTIGTNSAGDQLYPGPGNNSFVDRPPTCTSTNPDVPANCVPGIVRGGSGSTPGTRTDSSATGSASSSMISDSSIIGDDTGRTVTGTNIPAGSFVGAVSDTGPLFPTASGGSTVAGSFQLVDDAGNPVLPTGPVSGVTLGAECAPATGGLPSTCSGTLTADPLYDATDPTLGGGDTGSVLISPYITPGTSSTTYYNHYSWLRTMEDLFDVSSCVGTSTDVTLPAGTVCGGLDGLGHIGYAAQVGLTTFGSDVFSAPNGNGFQPITLPNTGQTPEAPLVVALPVLGLLAMGAYLLISRRRRSVVTH
jgi:LPXTG-motif cell wall-anchored protein